MTGCAGNILHPSVNQQTPSGKLFYKVINLLNKRRRMGDDDRREQEKMRKTGTASELTNLENLTDGNKFQRCDFVIFLSCHCNCLMN
jgi:hypothetical protein